MSAKLKIPHPFEVTKSVHKPSPDGRYYRRLPNNVIDGLSLPAIAVLVERLKHGREWGVRRGKLSDKDESNGDLRMARGVFERAINDLKSKNLLERRQTFKNGHLWFARDKLKLGVVESNFTLVTTDWPDLPWRLLATYTAIKVYGTTSPTALSKKLHVSLRTAKSFVTALAKLGHIVKVGTEGAETANTQTNTGNDTTAKKTHGRVQNKSNGGAKKRSKKVQNTSNRNINIKYNRKHSKKEYYQEWSFGVESDNAANGCNDTMTDDVSRQATAEPDLSGKFSEGRSTDGPEGLHPTPPERPAAPPLNSEKNCKVESVELHASDFTESIAERCPDLERPSDAARQKQAVRTDVEIRADLRDYRIGLVCLSGCRLASVRFLAALVSTNSPYDADEAYAVVLRAISFWQDEHSGAWLNSWQPIVWMVAKRLQHERGELA